MVFIDILRNIAQLQRPRSIRSARKALDIDVEEGSDEGDGQLHP